MWATYEVNCCHMQCCLPWPPLLLSQARIQPAPLCQRAQRSLCQYLFRWLRLLAVFRCHTLHKLRRCQQGLSPFLSQCQCQSRFQ